MKVQASVVMYDIISDLYDAVQEYVSGGGSVSGVILTLPSGLSFNLDVDFRMDPPTDFTHFRIPFVSGNVDIPLSATKYGVLGIFSKLYSLLDPAIPSSEDWTYDRGGVRQTGTSYSPDEKYHLFRDGLRSDGLALTILSSIVIILSKLGLSSVANSTVARYVARGTLTVSDRLDNISTTLDDVSTTLDDVSTTVDDVSNDVTDDTTDGTLKNLAKQVKVNIIDEGSVSDVSLLLQKIADLLGLRMSLN